MGSKDLKEEILKAFLVAMNEDSERGSKRGITGEETIHIRNAFLNYLSK